MRTNASQATAGRICSRSAPGGFTRQAAGRRVTTGAKGVENIGRKVWRAFFQNRPHHFGNNIASPLHNYVVARASLASLFRLGCAKLPATQPPRPRSTGFKMATGAVNTGAAHLHLYAQQLCFGLCGRKFKARPSAALWRCSRALLERAKN